MTGSRPIRYRIDSRKYPDHPHWRYEALYLGEDDYGLWLHLPSGSPARRGNAPEQVIKPGFVTLVPPNDPWTVEFYLNHPLHLIYVNVGTVPVVSGETVHQIDLDLDVVLTVEGEVAVLDEDEFVEHRKRFGYPVEIVEAALAATQEAQRRLTHRSPPFHGVADRWLAGLERSTLM